MLPNKAFKLEFDDNNNDDDDHADLKMSEGSIEVTTGKDEWLQANKLGLIQQEGAWLFDPAEGLPWVNHSNLAPGRMHIMGNNGARLDLIRVYIYEQLQKEPRNEEIGNIDLEWDNKRARSIKVSASIKGVEGFKDVVEV